MLIFVKGTLLDDAFWRGSGVRLHPQSGQTDGQIQAEIREGAEMFVKLGLIHTLFGITENAFRAYLRAIDPTACAGGNKQFGKIYECLFARLAKDPAGVSISAAGVVLLDLWREVRNSLHNNGVYVNPDGKDK